MRFAVSSDMEDDLAFMMGEQFGWTTGSCFTEGVVALSEFLKCFVRDVDDIAEEYRPPWTSSKALLRGLEIHSSVFIIRMINYKRIEAVFKVVVVVVHL